MTDVQIGDSRQRLKSWFSCGDDGVWIVTPDEGFWAPLVFLYELKFGVKWNARTSSADGARAGTRRLVSMGGIVVENNVHDLPAGMSPKVILKADRDNGIITLDSETQLTGIPPDAFLYKLGNRSGLDWILDQYKEKTHRDPTIREKFNTYRFADYKEKVVDLIGRVTRVSVETVAITRAMGEASNLGEASDLTG